MALALFLIITLAASAAARSVTQSSEVNVKKSNPEEGPYFQGDMKFGEGQFMQAKSGVNVSAYFWPRAKVFYSVASDFSFRDTMLIMSAIQDINDRTNCLKFVPLPRQFSDGDYIYIAQGSGCYSYVGRQGGQQILSLQSNSCMKKGIIIHELLHALGLFHEHSRYDRDDYITVHKENIQPEDQDRFEIVGPEISSTYGVGYDYGSIMHYPADAFSKNGKLTIVPVESSGVSANEIGQRKGLSDKDVQRIDRMYADRCR